MWSEAELKEHYDNLKRKPVDAPSVAVAAPTPPVGRAFSFTLLGAPRTKKTSNRIVQIKGKNGARGFTKILPSEAHEDWFKVAMTYAPAIRQQLVKSGAVLPLSGFIEVSATFYRERDSGDLLGYMQAIADWMQAPKTNDQGKLVRKGAGIICDDVQIRSWDGTRLSKDAACPRIEVAFRVVADAQPKPGDLFASPEDKW